MERRLKEEIDRLNKKLESNLEIVLDYFQDTEEKIEELEEIIEELRNGVSHDG